MRKTGRKGGKKKTPAKSAKRAKSTQSAKKWDRESYHLPVRSEEEQIARLPEDARDAWKSLKRFLLGLGPQEPVRTSHRAIMFSRGTCFAFVRPKSKWLELTFFLPKELDSELLKKSTAVSKTKFAHILHVIHSDQVCEPLTDWLREAYDFSA